MSATITATEIFDGLYDNAVSLVLDVNKGRNLTMAQLADAVARTHANLFTTALDKMAETHPERAALIRAEFLREIEADATA